MKFLKIIATWFINLIFPATCLSCGEENVFLCDKCFEKVKFLDKQVCHECKKEAWQGQTCRNCLDRFYLNRVWVAANYDKLMEEIITQFKYRFSEELGEILGQILLKSLKQKEAWRNIILVPVPLHGIRFNYRGFNQAELLARYISRKLKIEYQDLLIRIRNTKPQANLKRKERLINLRDSFQLRDEDFDKNKIIVLIDDVISTGTTLNECAKVLKASGVKEVRAMVAARG